MRRLARPTLAYGAAVAASGIALVSALVALVWLSNPDAPSELLHMVASDTLLSIVLPLAVVGSAVVLSRLARHVAPGESRTPAGTVDPQLEPANSISPAGRIWPRDTDTTRLYLLGLANDAGPSATPSTPAPGWDEAARP